MMPSTIAPKGDQFNTHKIFLLCWVMGPFYMGSSGCRDFTFSKLVYERTIFFAQREEMPEIVCFGVWWCVCAWVSECVCVRDGARFKLSIYIAKGSHRNFHNGISALFASNSLAVFPSDNPYSFLVFFILHFLSLFLIFSFFISIFSLDSLLIIWVHWKKKIMA